MNIYEGYPMYNVQASKSAGKRVFTVDLVLKSSARGEPPPIAYKDDQSLQYWKTKDYLKSKSADCRVAQATKKKGEGNFAIENEKKSSAENATEFLQEQEYNGIFENFNHFQYLFLDDILIVHSICLSVELRARSSSDIEAQFATKCSIERS